MIDFTDWLRNNMLGNSDIYSEQPRRIARKRVLTCVQTGVVACQDVFEPSFAQRNQALMRGFAVAPTNLVEFPQKPR